MTIKKNIYLSPQTAENTQHDTSRAVSVRDFKILRQRTAEDGAKLQAQITVNADEIALRATKTYVDGQDSNLESAITVNAGEILLRATKTYVDGQDSNLQSQITVNANAIILKASQTDLNSLGTRVTTAESTLTVQAGQIATKVSTTDLNTTLTNYSTITQTSTSISTYVGSYAYSKNEIDTTLGNYSTITQTATSIATRVATTDYNGNTIASLINQTATTIQISAEKLNLNGFVTLTNLTDGATTISGANIRTGSISATAVTIGGWRINSTQIHKGAIVLDSADERIYLNPSAFLFAHGNTGAVGVSGSLLASGSLGGSLFGATSGSRYAGYTSTNIECRDGGIVTPLKMNGNNILTSANFSLSGTTLTIWA